MKSSIDSEEEGYQPPTDIEYLRGLADRIFHIPALYGVDGGDYDQLRDLAQRIEALFPTGSVGHRAVMSAFENHEIVIHYLRSIYRTLREIQKNTVSSSLTLQGLVAADNLDWLDCYIDYLERHDEDSCRDRDIGKSGAVP